MTIKEFCDKTLDGAALAAITYGVNPIGMMAQSALETGWGKSAPGNMYFGIKAGANWAGKKQLLWTTEVINGKSQKVQAWFRAYDTPAQSFNDYGKLISSLSRYKTALKYPEYNQVSLYAHAIADGGYATALNYADSVISCANSIKQYVSEADLARAIERAQKKKITKFIPLIGACVLCVLVILRNR